MALLTMMMTLLGADGLSVRFKEVRFAGPQPVVGEVSIAPARQDPLVKAVPTDGLPRTAPSLPVRGSRFSTLLRARDILDLARTPAGAVAKLFRLDAAGKHSSTACTATFIGPRHLITASHCIVDISAGTPYSGFEVVRGLDGGQSEEGATRRVARAWVPAGQWSLARPEDALVTPERCSDYAVLELENGPAAPFWLRLREAPSAGMLYRFSYPHRAVNLMSSLPANAPADVRAQVEAEQRREERREPAFKPTDLYFEYGTSDVIEASHFAERSGQVINGQSGSALLDQSGAVVAILSRQYGGLTYNCRLGAQDIGSIAALVQGSG